MAFGDTEILARLSTGGMGEVLLGRRHGALGFEKLCAIKTIRGDLTSRADFRAMFLDEAKLVARLDHPTIAQVYDFGEEGRTLYLAMEYVAGVPLSQLLKAGRAPFPPAVAARILAEVCRGLHYAHEATDPSGGHLGVVHRDVSPQNLILTFEGRMKILDFGIAITKDREAPETAVGVLKGKPSYMAPEHLRGGSVDRRADVFSSAVVLHELLTGRKLFTRETALATALAVEGDPIEPPSAVLPDLDPVLDAIVMKGLSRSPDDRFPDARAMADALDRAAVAIASTTLEDYAKSELSQESSAHQAWLIDVLDRAEKHAADAKKEIDLNFEDTSLPGPPPEALPPPEAKPVPWNSIAPPPPARTSGPPPTRSSGPPGRTAVSTNPSEDTTFAGPGKKRGTPAIVLAAIPLAMLLAVLLWPRGERAQVEAVPVDEVEVAKAPEKTPEPTPQPTIEPLPTPAATPSPTEAPVHEHRPTPRPTPTPSKKPHEHERVEEEPQAGFGYVTIGAQPYALVRIDGNDAGVTPLLRKKLSAGAHDIELVSPDNGEVRLKKKLKLQAEEHARITIP
ncbi:MAG: protein kinase [Myxococcota bacterium]